VDHYMSSVMGRLPHTFGRERVGYSCGTLFVDHASGKLFNFCQYSTTAAKNLSNKCQLESIARQEGITIQEYHANNGIFASKALKADCDSLDQKYTFSGVGAHHQSGVAERNIKKQLPNGLGLTCCILLIIGQAKPMSAFGRRQLSMPYGFSTGYLTLKMAYRQMNFGHLVDLQLRNLIVPMCLAVRSMFSMQPFKMGTRYLNGHHVLILDFFSWILDSALIPGAHRDECRYWKDFSTVSHNIRRQI
jgi:hypothetical protein